MAGRFIKLYDKILSWEWFSHPNTLCLFIYLLLKANYKDLNHRGKIIRRGQLITSLPKIATDTGLSIQQIRTALSHLILTGEITDQSNTHYRLITIVKYDDYQTSTDRSTDKQQTINRQNNRQSTDNPTPCIESIEDIESNRRIDTPPIPPDPKDDFTEKSFSDFWSSYPKKRSKPNALRAWKSIKPDKALVDQIMAGLRKWSDSDDWMKENGRYIPYPATWLNNRGWEDDPFIEGRGKNGRKDQGSSGSDNGQGKTDYSWLRANLNCV